MILRSERGLYNCPGVRKSCTSVQKAISRPCSGLRKIPEVSVVRRVTLEDFLTSQHPRPFRGPASAIHWIVTCLTTPLPSQPSTQDPKRIRTCRDRHELSQRHQHDNVYNCKQQLACSERTRDVSRIQRRHGARRRHGAVSIGPCGGAVCGERRRGRRRMRGGGQPRGGGYDGVRARGGVRGVHGWAWVFFHMRWSERSWDGVGGIRARLQR